MDKKPNLSIAYAIKRKNAKKMAKGGMVASAASEKRPTPSEKANDSKMVAQNSAKPQMKNADWTSNITVAQAQNRPKQQAIKHPRMVPSNAFSVRLRDEEDDLQSSAKVNNGPQSQPPMQDDETDADKSGPETSSLRMKKMAKGGMINEEVSMSKADEDMDEHPAGLEEDDDQMRMPVDEYMAGHFAKGGMLDDEEEMSKMGPTNVNRPDAGFGAIIHKADGGMIDDEMEDEHYDSMAAAIMAKHKKMAEGGMVDIEENGEEMPNSYYHQNEDAALKENYDSDMEDVSQPMDSNEHGHELSDEDAHDMVSMIRRKMKSGMKFK